MKDIYGHEIPIIEDEIMKHFDITMQCFDTKMRSEFGDTAAILEELHKDLAADNAAAAQAEYGRGLTMVSVPLSSLVDLLGAGDYLHVRVGPIYVQAKDNWNEKAHVIRNFINDQS